MSAPIGSMVYAYTVQPGTVVWLPRGIRVDVAEIPPGPGFIKFVNLSGREFLVDSHDKVKVLGYFNVEP